MNVKAEKERAGLTRRGDVPSSPELEIGRAHV